MRLAPLAADTTKPRNPPEAPPRDPWSIKKRDVPYVPTDDQVVRGMLKLANVSPSDLLYDLGCGDGRIVIAAARRCGASAVGVDIDHQRLAECTENARRASHGNATRLPDGTTLWPMQRVMKRFQNGSEDSVYTYGYTLTKDFTQEPFDQRYWEMEKAHSQAANKPWWKFW